jgi:sulfur carrier protein ThiS
MQVKVVLFSVFREKLPRENRGRITLELAEDSTLKDLLAALDINIAATCSVNGQLEYEQTRQLQEGDEVQIFRPVGGG